MNDRFAEIAAGCGVPPSVVADAALHTFEMLDPDEQVDLIEEALARWAACAETGTSTNTVMSGDTKIIIATKRNQMRDDLIYRLQHEHFDIVYAYTLNLQKNDKSEWLFALPREGEMEVPPMRVESLLQKLLVGLRKARQRVDDVLREASRGVR